ncbi:MAG: zinc-binding dehydrogenase, partial [Planctomycetota bacterium]
VVGDNVKDFKPGDRVTFDSMVSCGNCYFCRQGMINMCDHRRILGVSCGDYRRHGAFAELVAVPQRIVYHIPENLSFEQAAMIEPVSVAVHAVNRTPLELGDKALVIGAGMIGLLCIQALRAAGCGSIYVVDIDNTRIQRALDLGADEGFNAKERRVRDSVLDRTGGHGCDVALEAVGATETITTAIESLRKGGALTLVGNITPQIELPLQEVVTREITLNGTCGCNGEYPQCIDLMARGAIEVDSLISQVAPLEEGPSWFQRLHDAEPGLMKVILTP